VAKNGDTFIYAGETSPDGWQSVEVEEEIGWISGMYARLVD
jgi:hypothetical protein